MGRKLVKHVPLAIVGLTFWAGASAADPMEGSGSDTLTGATLVESFGASENFTISGTFTLATFSYLDFPPIVLGEESDNFVNWIGGGISDSFLPADSVMLDVVYYDLNFAEPISNMDSFSFSLALIEAQAVGLPVTALLVGTGLFGLAALGRRRSR